MQRLQPIFQQQTPPTWEGATWIGAVEVNWDLDTSSLEFYLEQSSGFSRARLHLQRPDGHVDTWEGVVTDGRVAVSDLPPREAAAMDGLQTPGHDPSVTVVICTYDRPEGLSECLKSLDSQRDPIFNVVVVDNHPSTDAARSVVREWESRLDITYTEQPKRGLSRARNTGVAEANGEVVLFTDDDVITDRDWIGSVRAAFTIAEKSVACVSGIVRTGELRTPAQSYFDERVDWAVTPVAEVLALASPPVDEPLFPFQIARFGTGANFAVRRDVLLELGGFDEALGAGAPTLSGEDSDIFFRILLSGRQIRYDPASFVWHRHREEYSALLNQIRGYGSGYGAWFAKWLLQPRVFALFVRRLPIALRRVIAYGRPQSGPQSSGSVSKAVRRIAASERNSILSGPPRLAYARLLGARSRPLSTPGRGQRFLNRG